MDVEVKLANGNLTIKGEKRARWPQHHFIRGAARCRFWTSAAAYFSEDSPPTKLKYDARAAI
jgi:hypothetical protein